MATVWRSQRAFIQFFIGKIIRIPNIAADLGVKSSPESLSIIGSSKKYSNYAHSPFVRKVKEQYEFDVEKNSSAWTYVERVLPFETIPPVSQKDNYPSGWLPPREDAKHLPYFISRTKNHEIPIYLDITFRGQRKITKIKRIDGDIWLLNDEIKKILKETDKKYVETRVHEIGRFIEVKGDYVSVLRNWAYSKGL